MKESKLLLQGRNEIKLEQALRIMQFATEYNTIKAFYNNCPLNTHPRLIAQLNSQLQLHQSPHHSPLIRNAPQPIIQPTTSQTHPLPTAKEPSDSNPPEEDPLAAFLPQFSRQESPESPHDLPSYVSDHSREPLPVIHELSKQTSGIDTVTIQKEDPQPSPTSKQKKKKRVEKSVPKLPPQPQKGATNEILFKQTSSFRTEKQDKKPQPDLSGSSRGPSLGDRSASKGSTSPIASRVLNDSINESQKSLLRMVSHSEQQGASFQQLDKRNMQLLLRIENWQVQQRYLQSRIQKRYEKTYKQIKNIGEISWQSLNMPIPKLVFQRPNYAHVIE